MSNAMAAAIRSATESETFDLGGTSPDAIGRLVEDAFSGPPLPLPDMVRITFVTGAGRQGRQRYDEGAARAVTAALRSLGYEEDRGASCVVECGGSFKLQHDTGKNLKTVVVFPRVAGPGGGDGGGGGGGPGGGKEDGVAGGMAGLALGGNALLPPGTPERMVAASSAGVFGRNWAGKCPTWSQKRGCLRALEAVAEMVEGLDGKLTSGTPLEEDEQEAYDMVVDLEEKVAMVRGAMQDQVEAKKLTGGERDALLVQVEERIESLEEEIEEARAGGKPRKRAKLEAALEKAQARRELLGSVEPVPPPRLSREPDIQKLRAELRPLQRLEDGTKGRLLTVKETTALGRKAEIDEEIRGLEEASRGWFEDDASFAARVEHGRQAARARDRAKGGAKGGSKKGGAGSGFRSVGKSSVPTKFLTPSTRKAAPRPKKKPAGGGGGGVFGAMMMDSDSDSD